MPAEDGTRRIGVAGVHTCSLPIFTLAAGTYYFRVFYGGDLKNDPASSACADEVVTVTNAPSISTTLSATSGSRSEERRVGTERTRRPAPAHRTANHTQYTVSRNVH